MKKMMVLLLFAAAAILLMLFSFQNGIGTSWDKLLKENGQSEKAIPAAGQKAQAEEEKPAIEEMFEAEKEVVIHIEGMEEKVKMQLNKGKNEDYVIYIDEERYKMIKGEGDEPDVITTKEPLPEQYPEVLMTIEQVPEIDPDTLVDQVEADLKEEFPDLREVEQVTEPVEGYQLHGIANGGQKWDDPVVHAYVISNGQSGSFVITERYFLEAAEGHGARFYAMLQEFYIVELE
ncbi:hypothetical protein QWY16_01710 [Planococcus shenhongbingii]|uniref:Uncharacterized protein n=1 Tax=Planococcus shenhongbingii TaxID=3058398 RepID=A0ABT8NG41_9BACL|nr:MULTISPECIES: hypothetical protein [unclassified Planococcus (in: firmicutes)]MDN7246743.1 hypothetical protein [Planococcus sp. N017]WKA58899.1 hypothetical protein QWY16_01710 [Planococcus sp. N016]